MKKMMIKVIRAEEESEKKTKWLESPGVAPNTDKLIFITVIKHLNLIIKIGVESYHIRHVFII